MNRNIYIAGTAIVAACLTAGLVIILGRPSSPLVSAAPAGTTTTAASTPTQAPPTISATVTPLPTPTSTPALTTPTTTPVRPAHRRVSVPTLPAAKQTDAMAVAQTLIATMYSVDTAMDSDRTDGAHRAAYLMTPTLAATLTAPPTTGSGVRWQQWENAKAYVTVTSKKINIPWTVADNRLAVIRNIGFIQTVHTKAGTTALQQQTLALTLVRDADGKPWRVNSMETP